MNQSQLASMLAASFQDLHLDQQEKQQLRAALMDLPADLKRFVRNQAFELVRNTLRANPGDGLAAFRWLEQISKTLDAPSAADGVPSSAHFSPGDACRTTILDLLHRARSQVDICIFTLSDDRIAEAVLACHRRGVRLRVLTDNDKSNDAGSDVDYLSKQGVPVRMDRGAYHMHHKFALFDDAILLNGSFNWTRSASDINQENILVTADPLLVRSFAGHFALLWQRYS